MKILLFGHTGQIGWALQRALAPLGEVVSCGRKDVDFSQPAALKKFLEAQDCDIIVNAVAYTAVDQAESDADLARTVNQDSVAILARHAARMSIWLVHYSTDYVFDGTAPRPYVETDAPHPLSVYGQTKWLAELLIADAGCRYLIIRTSWIHSARGTNFVKTILKLASENQELRVTDDQFGAPTSADLVADVTAHALHQVLRDSQSASGIYHLAASGEVSWYEYARWLIKQASTLGFPLATTPDRVIPVTMTDFLRPARRPANCRLDTTKLVQQFAIQMPHWTDGAFRTMQEIAETRR